MNVQIQLIAKLFFQLLGYSNSLFARYSAGIATVKNTQLNHIASLFFDTTNNHCLLCIFTKENKIPVSIKVKIRFNTVFTEMKSPKFALFAKQKS